MIFCFLCFGKFILMEWSYGLIPYQTKICMISIDFRCYVIYTKEQPKFLLPGYGLGEIYTFSLQPWNITFRQRKVFALIPCSIQASMININFVFWSIMTKKLSTYLYYIEGSKKWLLKQSCNPHSDFYWGKLSWIFELV